MMRWIRALSATLLLFANAATAHAIIMVDDFESGAFSIYRPSSDETAVGEVLQDGLPILGGSRESQAGVVEEGASLLELVETPGNDALTATITPGSRGLFFIRWDGIPNGRGWFGDYDVDFTDGGRLDRIQVQVTEVTGDWSLRIGISDTTHIAYGNQGVAVEGPGLIEFPLAYWPTREDPFIPLDVTHVDTIGLSLSSYVGLDDTRTISIGYVAVVPEPGVAVLVGFGLAVLASKRPRRSPLRT